MSQQNFKGTTDTTKFAYYPTSKVWKEQVFRVCDNCKEYLGKEEKCRKCKKLLLKLHENE